MSVQKVSGNGGAQAGVGGRPHGDVVLGARAGGPGRGWKCRTPGGAWMGTRASKNLNLNFHSRHLPHKNMSRPGRGYFAYLR